MYRYAYDLVPIGGVGGTTLPEDRLGLTSHYRLYIIAEYCDGGSLAEAIGEREAQGVPHTCLCSTGCCFSPLWFLHSCVVLCCAISVHVLCWYAVLCYDLSTWCDLFWCGGMVRHACEASCEASPWPCTALTMCGMAIM